MALNIKDPETERLAAEVAALTDKSKTVAVRTALRELRDKLTVQESAEDRYQRFHRFLEQEIWPHIPPEKRGKPPLSKEEREEILGIGPEGV